MEIILNATKAESLLQQVSALLPKAVARALNRGISAARTFMVREVARDMGLRATDVRSQMPIVEATPSRLEARFGASKKRISLYRFGARGPVPSRGKGKGVTYRIGSGGRKRIATAFITTVGDGHTGVFVRVGTPRLPIKELFGPSLGQVFKTYRPDGQARGEEQFETTLAQELRYRASKT